ncbi:helix-turn-helix domain-containing protein [Streptomyces luteogriseus]|uniref:helix-turn-helix domain-containing protein n=1 Tax=Streptomyces luteogriseus TaxID=68233 RepID=UPI002E2FAFDB|nr:helix-turn-helix domain-containing protein [Streptomyces luteogriseus]WTJ32441.1 helix-turn-helix domain-containing protein [Streptomyces luteogriseus]
MGHGGGSDFAATLRELKERTPHSFETLAARTGISRSALHRYCSGQSVPADFATVERFAKRCGADREELVALHRLWVEATEPEAPGSKPQPTRHLQPGPVAQPAVEARPFWSLRNLVGVAVALVVGAGLLGVVRNTAGASGEERLLFSAACEGPVGMGEKGECVREVQRLLVEAGADLDVTGRFIGDTRSLVVAFQTMAGLHDNGVVDNATKRALYDDDVDVSLRTWTRERVADRIRDVFQRDAEEALRTAECQSLLEPLATTSQADATRTWGVFQLSERQLRELDGTPVDSLDPEWNIRSAHRLWSRHGDFRAWTQCNVKVEPVEQL